MPDGGDGSAVVVKGKPRLLFFYEPTDGLARKAERFLAQSLQGRRNHDTFVVHRIDTTERGDLAERFRVADSPALVVISDRVVRGRLDRPTSARQIAEFLKPWLL